MSHAESARPQGSAPGGVLFEARSLSKSFGDLQVLRSIDLTVRKGTGHRPHGAQWLRQDDGPALPQRSGDPGRRDHRLRRGRRVDFSRPLKKAERLTLRTDRRWSSSNTTSAPTARC